MSPFAPGQPIVWRSVVQPNIVSTVWPRTVVSDSDDLTLLYLPAGTVGKQRTGERGGPGGRVLLRWDGGHRDVTWDRTNVLIVHRPADAYSYWVAWDALTWAPRWRYLDLEEPWRRTPIGFDSLDLILDLWSEPDGLEWHWKDEDEFAFMVEMLRIDAHRASKVREIGTAALEHIRRRDPPFDRPWYDWRPDPDWPIPVLPDGWSEIEPRPK